MSDLTQEYLKSILDYNPETGVFKWKTRPELRPEWNTCFANKVAGWKKPGGYHIISINDKARLGHRLAWLYVHGTSPKIIDHIDGDGCNNKILNLRDVSQRQNCQNKRRKKWKMYSEYKGVSYCKTRKRWVSSIKHDGKFYSLGRFKNEKDAYDAYCVAAKKFFGEHARFA